MTPATLDPYLALAHILKEARLTARYTQSDLAEGLGKPQSYVSKYESGERRLDFVEVAEVCDALGIRMTQILAAYEARHA